MSKIFIILNIFFFSNAYSLELRCLFEEVYTDSSIQNGFFLVKDDKLRYEYHSENLFTLFHNHDQFFLVKNNDKEIINSINKNTEIIEELLKIASKYPNLENEYLSSDITIKLEKNLKGNFYKRISIASPQVNMSIYLNECMIEKIKDKYFSHNPFFEYEYN